uniref:Uncharacterized protein n=1 Tax=Chromera velia CCMP2878 TaxID=1169474 RepID=A0A0G4GGG1_9ALVE|eukprot:Cvel_21784.t1-p1 / transcript=Cvel_21784.t1 / gene=Cvel_21784 / organism=Chromera_velia_CCMP2878 / gene_product=Zinc finger protein 571, putative / transcript_product=Zinc finger protein 571, putative / location=Cvel_scaffold2074:4932-6464(+) / protein_length=511 / sequence_SO=supercontig / SO=protein_coding / is_pseudo=false
MAWGRGGEGGGVGVSELKFRLLAIPNNDEEVQVSDPGNLVCLEPLRGGDYRIVRLVGAPPLSDCSAVGERGVNTLHVGAEGGGAQQQREVVGISMEWGVPESVQLALLGLPTNRQKEEPHREYGHGGLSESQSEIARPPFSEGRSPQTDSVTRIIVDSQSAGTPACLPMCRPQSAVAPTRSDSESERDEGHDKRLSVRVCNPLPDDPTFPSHPSNCTHLQMRDRTRDAQSEERQSENADVLAVSVKRRRSESALTQVEADESCVVSGCPGERKGGASGRQGRDAGVLREEKQRRLTVSLSDSAPLSSEMCRGRGDPIAGGKVVVSENDRRGGEGGEVRRDRHGKILCLHGRVRTRRKECGGGSFCEHGRRRSQCKECGGKGICEHGRQRFQCRECGGGSFCEHGRQRYFCKDCGGGGICEHGRRRHECKECGGKSICEHGRIRSQCEECGGGSICEHGRIRSQCKECGGGSICEHGRQRHKCKHCGWKGICMHGRWRSICKECRQVSFLRP